MLDVLQALAYVLFPALVLKLERRFKIVETLSPVVVSYAAGIILGNLPGVGLNRALTGNVTEAAVLLAIPLLLFPTDFGHWMGIARETVIAFGLAIVAICVASAAGVLLFGGLVERPADIAGMLVGVYTGGTPNMTAIAMALEVPQETFILVNGADMLLGSTYLLFLMTAAKPLLKRFYPPFRFRGEPMHPDEPAQPQKGLGVRFTPRSVVTVIAAAAGLAGVSVGISMLLFQRLSAPTIILSLTTLAILASFYRPLRNTGGSYEAGQYLMLIFCFAIGTLADVQTLAAAVSTVLLYVAFVLVFSIVLHLLLAKLFPSIDVDTLIMASTAAVFGPPFVGPIANVLKNREVIPSGMTAGVVGLAIGNYLGIGMAMLLGG